jgi:hypothetical protein
MKSFKDVKLAIKKFFGYSEPKVEEKTKVSEPKEEVSLDASENIKNDFTIDPTTGVINFNEKVETPKILQIKREVVKKTIKESDKKSEKPLTDNNQKPRNKKPRKPKNKPKKDNL